MSYRIDIAGRYALEALASGPSQVCALFRRSFYVRSVTGRYACIGERTLGCGPLNALVSELRLPLLGEKIAACVDAATAWQPEGSGLRVGETALSSLEHAAAGRTPAEGLGCLIVKGHNPLASHAQPALDALQGWLSGNALAEDARELVGLGPGLTPSGDDYFGGMLVALRSFGSAERADRLWRWLEPQLESRTSSISAAHLQAAAAGEAHEAVHACLLQLASPSADWSQALNELDEVGHCSGWDALAGAVAVARSA